MTHGEREKYVARLLTNRRYTQPNKCELSLGVLLQEIYPNEYKYCGNFSVIIGGKNPDFFNINGQKKVIEMYGDHWHDPGSEAPRIEHFKSYGFDCLVIWEHELKNLPREELAEKIKCFHQRISYVTT